MNEYEKKLHKLQTQWLLAKADLKNAIARLRNAEAAVRACKKEARK